VNVTEYKKLYSEADIQAMRMAEEARLPGKNRVPCNPAGQAEYLQDNNTELNISFGLCMGHDIIFNQKSKAPVTTLIFKDREHKHNPYKEFENNV
jgi:uncharacterized metal-binding protein